MSFCLWSIKKSQSAGEARGGPSGLLSSSACALNFFIVYGREVRGAPAGLLSSSACACGLNIKIKNKTPTI